ncbi:MAG: hypothetical protein KGQ49_03710, partial [Verrucomicrobia bacterium]|nr:hypothetical protein [Verrucomicrobiota bacterium]
MTLPVFLASFFKRLFWALIPLTAWADLAEMSLDEKIGQLFVMPACPKRGAEHFEDLCTLIHECHVGSVIIKQSDPLTQVAFLNRLQSVSDHRLLVMADAEWGLAMRMADTMAFPRNMTLGAIQDLSLLKELGAEIGRQARLVGIDMNLAPVADVNTNPLNPIIGMRSFGEDPSHVADCVLAISAGMQSAGLLTCVKHFPGHGDTLVDSHKDLPIVHDLMGGLFPFQRAFAAGVDAVMTAHLYVPVIDPIWPTSLSLACLHMIKDCGFEGLIISDALNMGALRRYSPEEVAIRARAAGCDLLLYGDHIAPNVDEILRETIPRAFAALKRGYLS